MVRRCWVNFQCRGVLLIWITVWQGPTALAVGAGGGYLDIFSLVCHFSFSLSLGDGPIYTEILSQRAVKPKTTNQPTKLWPIFFLYYSLFSRYILYRCMPISRQGVVKRKTTISCCVSTPSTETQPSHTDLETPA